MVPHIAICRKMMMMFSLNFRLALGEVWSNGSSSYMAHSDGKVFRLFLFVCFFCTHRHPRSALIICVCLRLISLFYHTRPSRLWAVWQHHWKCLTWKMKKKKVHLPTVVCFKRKLSRLRYGLIESSTSQRLPNTQNLPESRTCDFQL